MACKASFIVAQIKQEEGAVAHSKFDGLALWILFMLLFAVLLSMEIALR